MRPNLTAALDEKTAGLPERDLEVLAVLETYADAEQGPLAWTSLTALVERIATQSSPEVPTLRLIADQSWRGVAKHLALSVNELINDGLVTSSPDGLSVTSRGRGALEDEEFGRSLRDRLKAAITER